jgi:tetratricopeptide (TPR) repeat protein
MRLNNIIILVFFILGGCSAVGYWNTNDFRTIMGQGFDMEKDNRFFVAHERYSTALKMAEESGDARNIAFAKYRLGTFCRNPNNDSKYYSLDNSIKYLKESLGFYESYPVPFSTDVYTALTEVYDKKGDKRSACFYLRKMQEDYNKKIIPNPKYAPNGIGYKYFYNATHQKFRTLSELIEYYNQKIDCGI